MPESQSPGEQIENRLLAALPAEDYQRLAPYLERVKLSLNQVIYQHGELIEYVYFPNQAMISLVTTMLDGSQIEVGLVGKEGMVGIPVFLGGDTTTNLAFVQIADGAMRMKASRLKSEFDRGGQLQSLLLRYMQAVHTQVSQTAACNRFHTVEERLARWLLLVSNAIDSDNLPLTQEFLGQMLGARRSGVTVAAGTLQQAGMIRYSRGRITILNREDLEATSCECYQVIKDEFARLLGN